MGDERNLKIITSIGHTPFSAQDGEFTKTCLMYNHLVYRFKKLGCNTKFKNVEDEIEFTKKDVFNQVAFVEKLMKTRLGSSYVVPMKLVTLPGIICDVSLSAFVPRRPGHRLCHCLSDGSMLAVEMPDLCQIQRPVGLAASQVELYTSPTYSIEIKPKWGFMPSPETGFAASDPKTSVCRFCMHQFLKISLGSWSYHSSYCPIDLFSGCVYRMKFALDRLLESPQNNLRLFKDGELFWGDNEKSDLNAKLSSLFETTANSGSSHIASLVDLVVQCLLHEDTTSSLELPEVQRQTCAEHFAVKKHKCASDCRLPSNCVLSRLLEVQRLNACSVEDVYTYYTELEDHFEQHSNERHISQINGPYSDDWLSISLLKGDQSLQSALYKVKEFLISRSAKDCSIFITMQRIAYQPCEVAARHFTIANQAGQQFVCCVTVVDLDPKRFTKIPFYREEDDLVVGNYVNNVLPLKLKKTVMAF